jgi:hypothetical protein
MPQDVRLAFQDLISKVILGQKPHVRMGPTRIGVRVLSIYSKLNRLKMKEGCYIFVDIGCRVYSYRVYYSCKLFKVAAMCLNTVS